MGLPPAVELGEGWSLGPLTAAQALKCREEGEAQAGEERDKALWANAVLLSRVLLRDGEPAFPGGEAVLEALTVGQIGGLTRLWWQRDREAWEPVGSGWDRAVGAAAESGENERFDMERFVELGGSRETAFPLRLPLGGRWPPEGLTDEGEASLSGASVFQEVSLIQAGFAGAPFPEGGQGPSRDAGTRGFPVESRQSEGVADKEGVPFSGATGSWGSPLMGHGEAVTTFSTRGEGFGRASSVEPDPPAPALTAEELDRALERDARRYDGGTTLL